MSNYAADIEKCFVDHQLKYELYEGSTPIETAIWQKPGTNNYRIVFTFRYPYLIVVGDCYEAIYYLRGSKSLKECGGLNFHYFHSKCVASENGARPHSWSSDKAYAFIKEYWKEQITEFLVDSDLLDWGLDPEKWPENWFNNRQWLAAGGNDFRPSPIDYQLALRATDTESEWLCYLGDDGYKFFGDDYSEYARIGHEPCYMQHVHWVAINKVAALLPQ